MDISAVPHPALQAVFAAFDRAGARWAVLRADLELADPDGDVDVLIEAGDLPRVRPLLEELTFVEVPGRGYGTHRFFLSHHEPSDRWVKLDLVTELAFGVDFGLSTGVERACLARRRRSGSAAVLDEGDAFWVLVLHLLLDRPTVTPPGAVLAQELARKTSDDSPLAAVVDAACPPGWSAGRLAEHARTGQWDLLAELVPALAAQWRRREGLHGRRRRARNRVRRARDKLLRLWFRPAIWTAYVDRRTVS